MTTAYGFYKLEDLYAQRVATVGIPRVYTAIQESAAEWTRVMNEMLSEFAERTTIAKEQFELPGSGTLQPLDEDGNPLPVLPSGSYNVAYPIQGGGTAWGTNRVSREALTVEEANRWTVDSMQRDADWLLRHMKAAIFDNVSWTFNDKVGANGAKGLGDITIEPLANGDSVIYNRKGDNAAAIDNHYLAQAGAIADNANPFTTIETELTEHPSNGNGRILVYVPTALKASIQGLTAFKKAADPDVRYGSTTELAAIGGPAVGPGDEVLGYVDGTKCWIIEWSSLPSDIMIAKMAGKPFLKMREYPFPALQGFFPEAANVDGNHLVNRMIRYCGFGVADRVAALVYRVGNASYAIPTGYDAPLAI